MWWGNCPQKSWAAGRWQSSRRQKNPVQWWQSCILDDTHSSNATIPWYAFRITGAWNQDQIGFVSYASTVLQIKFYDKDKNWLYLIRTASNWPIKIYRPWRGCFLMITKSSIEKNEVCLVVESFFSHDLQELSQWVFPFALGHMHCSIGEDSFLDIRRIGYSKKQEIQYLFKKPDGFVLGLREI